MKTYYLIANDYENINDRFYERFVADNDIALVYGTYCCYGRPQFTPAQLLLVQYRIIEACDGVLVDSNYKETERTQALYNYAKSIGTEIRFASKQWKLRKGE